MANLQEIIDKLRTYNFECQGGPLVLCQDWTKLLISIYALQQQVEELKHQLTRQIEHKAEATEQARSQERSYWKQQLAESRGEVARIETVARQRQQIYIDRQVEMEGIIHNLRADRDALKAKLIEAQSVASWMMQKDDFERQIRILQQCQEELEGELIKYHVIIAILTADNERLQKAWDV